MLVRKATSSDEQQILDCLRAAFQPYESSYAAAAYEDTVLTPETFQRRLAEMCIFVAVDESGDVAGTVACQAVGNGEGHVRGMAVHPDWQGHGIAEQLLNAVERELRKRQCTTISLDTTAPLERAIRFYEKRGFRASGRVVDFFGMPLYEYVKELKVE